jgi:hypothetical protein
MLMMGATVGRLVGLATTDVADKYGALLSSELHTREREGETKMGVGLRGVGVVGSGRDRGRPVGRTGMERFRVHSTAPHMREVGLVGLAVADVSNHQSGEVLELAFLGSWASTESCGSNASRDSVQAHGPSSSCMTRHAGRYYIVMTVLYCPVLCCAMVWYSLRHHDSLCHAVLCWACSLTYPPHLTQPEWTSIGASSNPWSWIDPGAFALVGAGEDCHAPLYRLGGGWVHVADESVL